MQAIGAFGFGVWYIVYWRIDQLFRYVDESTLEPPQLVPGLTSRRLASECRYRYTQGRTIDIGNATHPQTIGCEQDERLCGVHPGGMHMVLWLCELVSLLLGMGLVGECWTLQDRLGITLPADGEEPTVDILLPSCSEPLQIVRDTVLCALSLDYPPAKMRVLCCDDGGSDELRFWCHYVRHHHGHDGSDPCKPVLEYIRRTKVKGQPHHAKAGNLNHSMRYSSAEFVAIFDADMMPRASFLRRVLPHFHSGGVALAQTPQSFYNLTRDDPYGCENTFLYDVLLRAKDHQEHSIAYRTS